MTQPAVTRDLVAAKSTAPRGDLAEIAAIRKVCRDYIASGQHAPKGTFELAYHHFRSAAQSKLGDD